MGNCLRRSCPVHPASGNGRGRHVEEEETVEEILAGEKKDRHLRIKVRMRRDKLEELLNLARGDESSNVGKIGFLILQECMEGRLPARVLGSGDDVRRLSSIKEE